MSSARFCMLYWFDDDGPKGYLAYETMAEAVAWGDGFKFGAGREGSFEGFCCLYGSDTWGGGWTPEFLEAAERMVTNAQSLGRQIDGFKFGAPTLQEFMDEEWRKLGTEKQRAIVAHLAPEEMFEHNRGAERARVSEALLAITIQDDLHSLRPPSPPDRNTPRD